MFATHSFAVPGRTATHRKDTSIWETDSRARARSNGPSCRSFAARAVRFQLHALAYNLCNFTRTVRFPSHGHLTSLREKQTKIGPEMVSTAVHTNRGRGCGAATDVLRHLWLSLDSGHRRRGHERANGPTSSRSAP